MGYAGTPQLGSDYVPAARASATADDALSSRIWSGDVDALGELFDRHGAAALNTAGALFGSQTIAEDVVHDAFVSVWTEIGAFDSDGEALASWVLALTRRHAAERLDHRRRTRDCRTERRMSRVEPDAASTKRIAIPPSR